MASACVICAGLERGEEALLDEPRFVAFHHTKPEMPVHIVVATRHHFDGIFDPALDAEVVGEMLLVARRVAERAGLAAPGFRVVLNHGAHAEQEVAHLHVHVFGGRMMQWPPG